MDFSDQEFEFLVEETRRREDILDDTIEVVTRKAYYVFTLATTVLGFYLTSTQDQFADLQLNLMSTKLGFGGIVFYAVGAWMFAMGHSARAYDRVPKPDRLYEVLIIPEPAVMVAITRRRAKALAHNLEISDRIARTVNIQHDFLLFQIGLLGVSWILSQSEM